MKFYRTVKQSNIHFITKFVTFQQISTKLGNKVYVRLLNSCVKFHAKISKHCLNINKRPRAILFYVHPVYCAKAARLKDTPASCLLCSPNHWGLLHLLRRNVYLGLYVSSNKRRQLRVCVNEYLERVVHRDEKRDIKSDLDDQEPRTCYNIATPTHRS